MSCNLDIRQSISCTYDLKSFLFFFGWFSILLKIKKKKRRKKKKLLFLSLFFLFSSFSINCSFNNCC
uniref:Uncharacterized protein n=1 Tax=Glossina palpalis gambiensis TaxID=67801 RepID=A0A1B0BD59_9MUSC